MKTLKLYLEIYRVQIKNNWVREAVYRANFFTSILVELVWMVVEFSLFSIIYSNVTELGGWTKVQVYFFLGIFFASDAIFTIFFQRNFWMFSDLVNKGELDILLTKPVHPLFLALTRWISLTSFFSFLMGMGVAIRYAGPAGFEGGLHWIVLLGWLLVGVAAAIVLRFAFSIWVFWTDRAWAISRLYYQFFQLANKPDAFYPKVARYVILSVLPFAFIASVPARALLQGLAPWEYGLVVGIILFFLGIDALLWRAGLRRYQSASS
jgi:ABC-2 type transport system permease protein